MAGELYRFGGYLLDSKQLVLFRGEELVHLPPKAVELLAVLIEARSQLVNKDDLMGRLWPDAFVEEANLARNVYLLRHTLGKRPEGGDYIETIPRRGYRFAAEAALVPGRNGASTLAAHPGKDPSQLGASVGDAEANAPRRAEAGSEPPPRQAGSWRLAFVAGLVVAAAAIFLIAFLSPTKMRLPLKQFPLTFNSALLPVSSDAISPNGRYLAYVDPVGAHVRNVDTGAVTSLPEPPGAQRVAIDAWLPDGSGVLATAVEADPAAGSLWRIPVVGQGKPDLIQRDVGYAAVSSDGKSIAFTSGDQHSLEVMAANGERSRELLEEAPGWKVTGIAWLPGSERIEAISQPSSVYDSTIELVDTLTCRASRIDPHGRVTSLVPLPDGRTIFSMLGPPPFSYTNLWIMRVNPRTGRTARPRQITDWAATGIRTLSASADGRQVAFVKLQEDKFVAAGFLSDHENKLENVHRITLDDRNDFPHDWMPDGEVLFESDRTGPWQVYRKLGGGSGAGLIAVSAGDENYPRLSPDGRWILYMHSSTVWSLYQSATLMRVPAAGGLPERVASLANFAGYRCTHGQQGRCVLAQRQGGRLIFHWLDPQKGIGGEIRSITLPRQESADWDVSPDASQIALITNDTNDGMVRVFPLSAGREHDVRVTGWTRLQSIAWRSDGKGWFIGDLLGGRGALLDVTLAGAAHLLWRAPNGFVPYPVPSADGRRLAFPEYATANRGWMIENY